MNPQASRTCNFDIDGFSYERDPDWGVSLVSTVPNATVSVSCAMNIDELDDPKTAIQCDNSCVCEPISGVGCTPATASAATLKPPLGLLLFFSIAVTAFLANNQ